MTDNQNFENGSQSNLSKLNYNRLEELADDCATWSSKNPLMASLLALSVSKLGFQMISKIKNRKGSNLFIELDLSKIILKEKPVNPIERLFGEKDFYYYRDILEALELAAQDSCVSGIIVKSGAIHNVVSLSVIWELREVFKLFKTNGKKTIAYVESFGERGENMLMYYLISGFDEIHVPPTELITINGLMVTGIFLKQLLQDKLDIDVQILQREKFKNYANMFKEDKFTPEHYEQLKSFQDYLLNLIIDDIASDRNLSKQELESLMNEGFFNSEESAKLGLITHVGFRESAYLSAAKVVFGHKKNEITLKDIENLNLMFITQYAKRFGRKYKSIRNIFPWTKKIAVVHLHGGISCGDGSEHEDGIRSDYVTRTLRALRKEKKIQAVIIHISSPGGSATASDTIRHEIELLHQEGKKIIIFQSTVAASGGYWISLTSDAIVCTPLTITGSIGVVFGKLNLRGMWKKIGITFDNIEKEHQHADFLSTLHSWDEESLKSANKLADMYYDKFKDLVSEKRNLSREVVNELAQGKVYFGNRAYELKLVDHIGGMSKAIEVAKELIGLSSTDFAQVINYPPQPTIAQMILKGIFSSGESRNSNDQDELRRKGFQTQTFFNSFYRKVSVLPFLQKMQSTLLNGSPSQIHQALSTIQSSNSIQSNIEAYSSESQAFLF